MVPLPQTSLTRTGVGTSTANASAGGGFFRKRRPLITYGRKDTKPLLLTGSHFRRDPYTLPADDEEQEVVRGETEGPFTLAGARALLDAAQDDDDDDAESELSDKPDNSPGDGPDGSQKLVRCQRAGDAAATPIVLSNTGKGQSSTAYSAETPKTKRKPAPTTKSSIPAPKRAKRSPKETTTASITAKTPRRLPVQELLLVPTPLDYTNFGSPQSSVHGNQTQDPINDRTSSAARWCNESPNDSKDETESRQKQPLSAFTKRLRSSKHQYKNVVAMRRKRAEQSTTSSRQSNAVRGDGFDSGELYISPLVRKSVRRRRPRQDPLISGFKALRLQSGPLPDVAFEAVSLTLKVEAKSKPPSNEELEQAPPPSGRHVSFSDRAQEDDILAQLSSISAPAVPRPESDDEDGNNDDGFAEEEEVCTEIDEDQIADGFEAIVNDDDYGADTKVEGHPECQALNNDVRPPRAISSVALQPRDSPCTTTEGVSLDFRPRMPGQLPRRRIRQDTLVEVHEKIDEVPDSDSLFFPRPQPRPALDVYQVQPQATIPTPEMLRAPPSQLKRPRSILRNASQQIFDSTTHAENTAANTRRNSTVELSESRYFTDAAHMLRNADPAKHKIVPRRRTSSYFDEVEMLDSQAVVPETSTPDPETDAEMLDYSERGDLAVLRRTSHVEWTSQSSPAAAVRRDLSTLTRSVSRDYGTLSQSKRRRPSLPFQSPRKVR